ncbi:5'-nucleotidase, lipoprotein e(P4) family [Escherichia coli O13]|uniref:5'-nucleotidase, lipoprotein e(P4) family n=1 Tax=Escherichia coli TaxID=562 RepID=UPI00184F7276|nr:5'-nucleotidase, lipoprotein e(P4) family [Escherichia coli]EFA4129946.1 5'-nucleotidase, lipoprotein e(P4) family [Escherichia coli O13]HAM3921882.1 5'-nucleotidase, lipoprotein e(P4) family [Escherichia coli]
MKHTLKLGMAVAAMVLTGCTGHLQSEQQLSSQAMLAVNWMQQSGEYQALSWQAFNIAKTAFLNNPAPKGNKKAVIVDIDETMVDNTPYAAWQIKQSRSFNEEEWSKWVDARQAKALPGAVSFVRFVLEHGGKVFYISNRSQQELSSTLANLKAQGFPGVSTETLLLKDNSGSNKIARFNLVKEMGYFPVLYVGDNLNDFTGATYRQDNTVRKDFVIKNHQKFGAQFIILPNPSYGDWEGGMKKGYWKLSKPEKIKVRDASLSAWTPSVR